jgi:ABC-type glycerol-3-phosphate transport system permease component
VIVRRRRFGASDAGAAVLSVAILIWTLAPLYNMVLVAVQDKDDVFTRATGC